MKRDVGRHTESRSAAFTIFGLLAFLLYSLACRPSWSPDGSKLLYSYYNSDTGEAGVALFDRATGTTRSIFVVPRPSYDRLIPAQWETGGERAVVWPKGQELLLLPLESSKPAQPFELPEDVSARVLPIPEVAGNLYFSGGAVSKVDLRTGEVTSRETEKDPALYGGRDSVYYLAKLFEPVSGSDDEERVRGYEIGTLDLDELTLRPLFELDRKVLQTHGGDELFWTVAFDPKGDRMALTLVGVTGASILVCSQAGLLETIMPELPFERYDLRGLQWSLDGKSLYAAVLSPDTSEDRTLFSVAEIPLRGAPPRLIRIAQINAEFNGRGCGYCGSLQIALSPDGSTLATSTALLEPEDIKEDDRALYLVDLTDPARKVTKFPPPFSPNEPIVAVGRP